MHELSIACSIIDLAAEESQQRGGVAVRAVHVLLGPVVGRGQVGSALRLRVAQEDSPLAAARLLIEESPIVIHCGACDADTTLDWPREFESLPSFACAQCGVPTADIRSGRELEVTALEIDA